MRKEIPPKTKKGLLTQLVTVYFKDKTKQKSTEPMCILYLNKL